MDLKSTQCEFESLLGHHKDPYDIASIYIVVDGCSKLHRILDLQVKVSETGITAVQYPAVEFLSLDSFTIRELGIKWHDAHIPSDNYKSMHLPAGSTVQIRFSQKLISLEHG